MDHSCSIATLTGLQELHVTLSDDVLDGMGDELNVSPLTSLQQLTALTISAGTLFIAFQMYLVLSLLPSSCTFART